MALQERRANLVVVVVKCAHRLRLLTSLRTCWTILAACLRVMYKLKNGNAARNITVAVEVVEGRGARKGAEGAQAAKARKKGGNMCRIPTQ